MQGRAREKYYRLQLAFDKVSTLRPATIEFREHGEVWNCSSKEILDAVEQTEQCLSDTGRVLLRPSGTEPLIRVMVEGEDEKLVRECCDQLADKVQKLI